MKTIRQGVKRSIPPVVILALLLMAGACNAAESAAGQPPVPVAWWPAEGDPPHDDVLLRLTTATDGGGVITLDPPGGVYFSNSLVVATASPEPGWTFLQWLGDVTGNNLVANITMTRDKDIKAVFGTILNTNVVGMGRLILYPAGEYYPFGTDVRFTAVPQEGFYFARWGGALNSADNPVIFTVTNAMPTITAVIASLGGAPLFSLAVVPDGRGRVDRTPPGNTYEWGTNVVLTAVPEFGQEFLGWSGDTNGTINPLILPMEPRLVNVNGKRRRGVERAGGDFRGRMRTPSRIAGPTTMAPTPMPMTSARPRATIRVLLPAALHTPIRWGTSQLTIMACAAWRGMSASGAGIGRRNTPALRKATREVLLPGRTA